MERIATASYLRKQAKILLDWASGTPDPAAAVRLRARAQNYLFQAEALEPQAIPALRLELCVPRTSSGVMKVRPGNIGDEGRQE